MREAAEDGLAEMAQAHTQMVTPRKTGALRGTSRIESTDDAVAITYGGTSAGYAEVQERGIDPRTGAPFRHYTTPGTGPHYLETTFRTYVEQSTEFFAKMENRVRAALRSGL